MESDNRVRSDVPGCDRCYAMTLAKRLKAMGGSKYERDGDLRRCDSSPSSRCWDRLRALISMESSGRSPAAKAVRRSIGPAQLADRPRSVWRLATCAGFRIERCEPADTIREPTEQGSPAAQVIISVMKASWVLAAACRGAVSIRDTEPGAGSSSDID